MKAKIIIAFLLLASIPVFMGCQEDELLTTDFQVVLYQDFVVNNTTDSLFSIDTLLDAAAQSSDIEKYKDKIQDVTLTKVTYLLTSFNGDSTQDLTQGSITVAEETGANSTLLTSMSNVNLKGLLNNETQLTVNQPAVELVGNLVENTPHKLLVSAMGTVDQKPLDFTIRIRFYLTIKAKVL